MENKIKASKKELFYDNISHVWEDKINSTETEKRLKVIFEEMFKSTPFKSKKFLEVGCGLGYFSQKALSKKAQVTGVDVGKNLISICKKKMPKGKFVLASALDLPFKDNSFDIVLCTEVIEHVEYPEKAINELIRVTKPKGKILITTPNKLFKPFFSLLSIIGVRPYHGNENWIYPWRLKSLLLAKNTRVLREKYFNFVYPIKFFDKFEDYSALKYLMINHGYLVEKI